MEARTIAEAARDGDALAQAAIQRAAWALGAMARSLTLAFSPDHIVLGGGVMRSFDLFLPTIEAAVRLLISGEIVNYVYDAASGTVKLVE